MITEELDCAFRSKSGDDRAEAVDGKLQPA
jgi:hypothetical protein